MDSEELTSRKLVSGKVLKKTVAVIFLLAALLLAGLLYFGSNNNYLSPSSDRPQSLSNTPEVPPAQKSVSPGISTEAMEKALEPLPALTVETETAPPSTLNLQLPKNDMTFTNPDMVLPESRHDLKGLFTDTQKTKQSNISVGGSVFFDDEKKVDPNAPVRDQLKDQVKGGEVSIKVKTK
jgi:hypothetical protein